MVAGSVAAAAAAVDAAGDFKGLLRHVTAITGQVPSSSCTTAAAVDAAEISKGSCRTCSGHGNHKHGILRMVDSTVIEPIAHYMRQSHYELCKQMDVVLPR
jgi:hypothetical protein